MSAPKPLLHFWEGQDSNGREVRAFLAESNVTRLTAVVPLDMKLPVVIFRALRHWKVEHYRFQEREEYAVAVNEMNERYGRRKKPAPKQEGKSWVVIAYAQLDDLQTCREYATPYGLEKKFRPGMARLSVEQLGSLAVALDAWMETGRSIAKELRK